MAERKKTDGSLALNAAPRLITIPAAEQPKARKLRVAAYCRVSSDSRDQLNSFAAQNAHYTALISENPDWELVDIYADRGISGTSADKREDFQRLLSDCKRGLIDKVLVKSVSRFARNTQDFLKTTRELKAQGVEVFFEEQNIDSSMVSGETLASIFAALAQKESESISQNMRMSYQRRMAKGTLRPWAAPYGYILQRKSLEINESQATIVRWIFNSYLTGKSMKDIADELNQKGITAFIRGAKRVWRNNTISYILSNERYVGDSLWQKTYATDSVPTIQAVNRGEKEKYYAFDTHPPIVSKELFQAVQELRKKRDAGRETWKKQVPYPLRSKLYCGNCGTVFQRNVVRDITYWVCRQHYKASTECGISKIREDTIYNSFLRLYYKLQHQGRPVLEQLLANLQTARSRRLLWSLDVVELNNQIAEISRQERLLAVLKKQGAVDPDIFISRTDRLVDKIIVESNERLRFRLINGLELTENIERTVR